MRLYRPGRCAVWFQQGPPVYPQGDRGKSPAPGSDLHAQRRVQTLCRCVHSVLVFTKTGAGGTDKVWFYDMQADGYSLDDKRTVVPDNDIPDIIARFRSLSVTCGDSSPRGGAKLASPAGRGVGEADGEGVYNEAANPRTAKSFFVPKSEIVENGYDLSINKYKKTEYKAVEYPSTTEILADLHELEMQITAGLAELEEML